MRMRVDGEDYAFTTSCLVVANGAPMTSLFARGSGAPQFDDGALDITWLDPTASGAGAKIAGLLLAAITGSENENAGVHYMRGKEIQIDTSPVAAVVIDGEVCEKTPLNIRVQPNSLKVIADVEMANRPKKGADSTP